MAALTAKFKRGVEVDTSVATACDGDGTTFPRKNDRLCMHYTGTLAKDGSKFDSSRDRDKPFEFVIGTGQVIKGWDEGASKLSLGQRATLKISSDFGYGEKGHPPVIPEDADLIFDVEVLSINGKKAFYSKDDFERYVAKLESWKGAQLLKFDEKEAFRVKKETKHGDRAGFEAWLTAEVVKNKGAVKVR